jgi:thiosulfate/3-mercaptopyruvate sulfurtransferase
MLPSGDVFASYMSQLGIKNGDLVVVYDGAGMFSAPRLWWMLRVFGHQRVRVLNGGLPAWRRAGGDVVSLYNDKPITNHVGYAVSYQPNLVIQSDDVLTNIEHGAFTLLDARASERFAGMQAEPRPGVRSGHIPNSCNLPFKRLLDVDLKMLPKEQLRQQFEAAGVDINQPLATSCGSGVTACVLALALYCLGKTDVPVYDGSWGEWGARHELPLIAAEN